MADQYPRIDFYDGRQYHLRHGITLEELRRIYPTCFLVANGNRIEDRDEYVLLNVPYKIMFPYGMPNAVKILNILSLFKS
jgi:hypothetical protein